LREFDQEFISGHLRCMKPDPAIYAHLELDTGVSPGGLLFADDKQENLDAAAARGWQTHLFTSPAGFEKRLIAEGLITKDAVQ
jgi:2-haloacid dehalogenase